MVRSGSPLGTIVGTGVALVALVGAQFFGWEWGSGQPLPTLIGVLVAGVAVALVAMRVVR